MRVIATTRYAPGMPRPTVHQGDLILTRRRGLYSSLIGLGQSLRFRGELRRFSHWTHAALVVTSDGMLVEALGKGVVETELAAYDRVEYVVAHVDAPEDQRYNAARYAVAMVDRHARYDWWEIASLGLQLVTNDRLSLVSEGTAICSGLVATALERCGVIWPRAAEAMRPADLAEWSGL